MLFYLIIYLVIVSFVLVCNQDQLHQEQIKAICERLYPNVRLNTTKWCLLYYPVFMLRRLLFVYIVIFFEGYGSVQITVLAFFSSLYIMWYGSILPHHQLKFAVIELSNECLLLCICYHLFTFTAFIPDLMMHQSMGISYILALASLISANISYILYNALINWQSNRRKKLIVQI